MNILVNLEANSKHPLYHIESTGNFGCKNRSRQFGTIRTNQFLSLEKIKENLPSGYILASLDILKYYENSWGKNDSGYVIALENNIDINPPHYYSLSTGKNHFIRKNPLPKDIQWPAESLFLIIEEIILEDYNDICNFLWENQGQNGLHRRQFEAIIRESAPMGKTIEPTIIVSPGYWPAVSVSRLEYLYWYVDENGEKENKYHEGRLPPGCFKKIII